MELIEVEDYRNGVALPDGRALVEVPLEDFIKQDLVRYIVRTSAGDVALKFIGALRRRTAELELQAADPAYMQKRADFKRVNDAIRDLTEAKAPVPGEMRAEQLRLAAALEPGFYHMFAGCFEIPRMRDGSQVLAFINQLEPCDQDDLRLLLVQLIAARPAGEVATKMLALAAKYGIRISDHLTLENMTSQQFAILEQANDEEWRTVRALQREASRR